MSKPKAAKQRRRPDVVEPDASGRAGDPAGAKSLSDKDAAKRKGDKGKSKGVKAKSKGDKGKGASDRHSRGSDERTPSRPNAAARSGGPAGQRLYDMPYSAAAPRLINPEIGLHNLVTRAGHNAGYTIDVTLLDAPDHRLIRSGVLLAHRVLDGRGEWYLGAAEWQPTLPEERIVPMGQTDLPEEFTDLVRPFRRRATLGPVAALSCERREFALRDDRGTTMALLRDDKVTVRRGGLTTARYREVMLTPTGPGLNDEQAAFVAHALAGAGATQVPRFPRLVTRLGAPATGPTDFPAPQSLEQDTSFAQFVSHLLATRLREMLQADLAIRTDDASAGRQLAARAAQLRAELQGLSTVIDVGWLEDLDEELDWIADQARQAEQRDGETRGTGTDLRHRLRGERYLTLLDRLVTATRAPQVGNASGLRASEVLGSLVNQSLGTVVASADRLDVDTAVESWVEAGRALDSFTRVTAVASYLLPARVHRLRHRLGVASQLLAEAAKHDAAASRSKELASRSSPGEAFTLGRTYEHELAVARTAREAFVRRWRKTAKKLE